MNAKLRQWLGWALQRGKALSIWLWDFLRKEVASRRSRFQRPTFAQSWPFIAYSLIAVIAFELYTHNNDFSFFAHKGEPKKLVQVLRGDRLNNHPALMLNATAFFVGIYKDIELFKLRLSGVKKGDREYKEAKKDTVHPQVAVQIGRNLTVLWMVLGILALCGFGHLVGGPIAGIFVGVLVMVEPNMVYIGHFFKEDGIFLAGVCCLVPATYCFVTKPTWASATGFGVAEAFVLSGKYIGVVFFLAALAFAAVVLYNRERSKSQGFGKKELIWVGASFLISLIIFHISIFANFAEFRSEMGIEWEKINHQNREHPSPRGFIVYPKEMWDNVVLPLWLLLLPALALPWLDKKHRLAYVLIFVFAVSYFLIIAVPPKTNLRYLIPVFVMMHIGGALLLAYLLNRTLFQRGRPAWVKGLAGAGAAVFLLWAVVANGSLSMCFLDGFGEPTFADKTRRDVIEKLPKDAYVLQLGWRLIPDDDANQPGVLNEGIKIPQRTLSDKKVVYGTVQDLIDKGITHIVLFEGAYVLFVDETYDAEDAGLDENSNYMRQKRFFRELFERGKVVFKYELGPIGHIHQAGCIVELPKE